VADISKKARNHRLRITWREQPGDHVFLAIPEVPPDQMCDRYHPRFSGNPPACFYCCVELVGFGKAAYRLRTQATDAIGGQRDRYFPTLAGAQNYGEKWARQRFYVETFGSASETTLQRSGIHGANI